MLISDGTFIHNHHLDGHNTCAADPPPHPCRIAKYRTSASSTSSRRWVKSRSIVSASVTAARHRQKMSTSTGHACKGIRSAQQESRLARSISVFCAVGLLFFGHLCLLFQFVSKGRVQDAQGYTHSKEQELSMTRNAIKVAFATLLSGFEKIIEKETTADDDPYCRQTRMLGYQLLHDPVTRNRLGAPLIVCNAYHQSS